MHEDGEARGASCAVVWLPDQFASSSGYAQGRFDQGSPCCTLAIDGLDGGDDRAPARAVFLVEPHQEDQHDALPPRRGVSGFRLRIEI